MSAKRSVSYMTFGLEGASRLSDSVAQGSRSEMILVASGSGQVGSAVVTALAARRIPVRALSRKKQNAIAGVSWMQGDFADPSTLAPLLDGVRTVFLSAATGPAQVAHECAMIDACRRSGVDRIIKLSGADAYAHSVSPYRRANGLIETALQVSALDFAVIRPTSFIQNLRADAAEAAANGRIFDPFLGVALNWTDIRDVADVAVALLGFEQLGGMIYELTGPEPLSCGDIARRLQGLLQRPVVDVPSTDTETYHRFCTSGWAEADAHAMVCHYQAVRLKTVPFKSGWIEILTGNPPRSVDNYFGEIASLIGR